MILTATEVTALASVSASAATIAASGLIEVVQTRLCLMLNNYFTSDMYAEGTAEFTPSARTAVMDGADFEELGFLAGDDVVTYRSYRNDGVRTLESASGSTLTFTTASTALQVEPSGRTVVLAVVQLPSDVKRVAAQMVAYDLERREKYDPALRSRSLGPWSESYTAAADDDCGYPRKITDQLDQYRIARVW